ncbi:MAG: HPr family phosphocarrier protein [Candidatus Cloacimonetes bacterium]|nr:HPr family phosphocarrier protein [Candidatus Cloacimonadota bacterium]
MILIIRRIKVINRLGLHARPSTLLVKKATQFRAELKVRKEEMEVNGKSLLGVLTLAAEYGSELELIANGIDEEEMLMAIERLFQEKFEEE